MNENWQEMKENAVTWLKEAGNMLKEAIHLELNIQTKTHPNDLVTEMDYKVEQFLTKHIKDNYPAHRVLGEEGEGANLTTTEGILWIIDPIDGTTNFVHQKFNFTISLAIISDSIGQVGIVYNVMNEEWYTAVAGKGAYFNNHRLKQLTATTLTEAVIGMNGRWLLEDDFTNKKRLHTIVRKARSVRSYGSASLELAYVATGRLDSYINFRLSPWDYAAGIVILKEVGGLITDFNNRPLPLLHGSSVLASRPQLHDELVQLL